MGLSADFNFPQGFWRDPLYLLVLFSCWANYSWSEIHFWSSVYVFFKKMPFRPNKQRVNSGKVVHNSSKTTWVSPLPFIASPPPKSLFFFDHFQSSSHYCDWNLYVGLGVAWSHTVGAAIFHWAFCLLGFFISKPSPLELSPLLTIKDAPSPPPPTLPILSHDPLPLLMWNSYVTSRRN